MARGKAWTEPHDGAWRVRAKVDGKKRTVNGRYATEAAADVMRDAWNMELESGGIASPDTLTLAKLGDVWLAGRELNGSRKRVEVKSIASEKSAWRTHVLPSALAGMHPASIRVRDVEAFALWLRSRTKVQPITMGSGTAKVTLLRPTQVPLSTAMQREALRLVRGALDEGIRQELFKSNPAAKVCVARGGPPPRDLSEDWLREDEIEALLSCEAIEVFRRTIYATAIGLALRLADIKAIKREHVHLDAKVPGPHVEVRVSKSGKDHKVPVPNWLSPWLRTHLATLPAAGEYVFQNPDGDRYGKDYEFGWARKRERRGGDPRAGREGAMRVTPSALELAGVKRKIRFHDLRGTTATHLALGSWGRTWSLHEIQGMLAHSDQHVTERYVRRAVDSLAQAMRETQGGPTSLPSGPPRSTRRSAAGSANVAESLGSESRTRTYDHPVNSRTLYQLSYLGMRRDF